jgi:4-amino-4-deoxy-L-arabinose transferase-like glycosyltransferase
MSSTTSTPPLAAPGRLHDERRGGFGAAIRRRLAVAEDEPRWVRPSLLAVVALAAFLCLWHLTINGYSNTYYAAATKSATESWKAWFFGSLDPGSFITVDKPPLSLWLSGLSARILGFSSFSILLPEALCTIAAVALLYHTVKRVFGPAAGLLAAGALAITPVTVAIGRVNNPDALLVLLMVGAAYLLLRAVESGRTKHLLWCGALVGLAFMTKLLQGWMIVPALGLTYLLAGPVSLRRRLGQLAAAGATMVAVSAAWPLAVTLWPGSTPYIGGSTNGSVWNLIFGYDGFGRITGEGGGQGANFGGAAGLWRMFNDEVGGQIAWLLPFAAVSLIAGLWLTRGAPRTDRRRAAFVLFGVWALVHVAIFSTQKGVFHPYYVSALAPAVAALTGAGLVTLGKWARRSTAGHAVLALTTLGSAVLAVVLLDRTADYAPALRVVIPVFAVIAVLASVAWRLGGGGARRLTVIATVAATIALAAGPAAYSVANLGRSMSGNNVLAGPASIASVSMGGPGGGGGTRGFGGSGGPPSGTRPPGNASSGTAPSGASPGGTASSGMPSGRAGGSLSARTIAYLEAHQGSAKYLLAAEGSQATASIIISTGRAVVTIGGFSGTDPAPTVAEIAQMVAKGELRYVLISSGTGSGGGATGGPGGRGGTSSAIASWVEAHGTAVSGAGVSSGTLYELGS